MGPHSLAVSQRVEPDEALLAAPPATSLFSPGRNCWRIAKAGRAAVLVDGAAYFAALETALRGARRQILIVGWDFDGRIRLRHDADEDSSPPLGPLLRLLVEARPDLEVRILVWSVATVHGPGAALPLIFGADWQDHPRITLKLDAHHPFYAAHHQKIVCIDDALAFSGGMDLTVERWDTPGHRPVDPLRHDPDGEPYTPVHDIQMAVDGDAARALGDLARARWADATGETLPVPSGCAPLWPEGVAPEMTGVEVAIARTMPAYRGRPSVEEAAALTADMLAAAREAIYIEAQYLTARYVGDALQRLLEAETGPDIVIVLTRRSHDLIERVAMGTPRDRLLRRLRAADHAGRLFVGYPAVCRSDAADDECQVLVHAKLVIVDDAVLRVGSSNLNNRSVALDTECDLAVEGRDPATRGAILDLRHRLLAEHLAATPEAVADAVRQEGSLVRAVRRLNGGPRGLRPFDVPEEDKLIDPILGSADVLDPERPFGA